MDNQSEIQDQGTRPDSEVKLKRNKSIILLFYILSILTGLVCSWPNFTLQNIGYTMVSILLVAAYIARALWPKGESFEENHSTYIIRTIWHYSIFALFGMIGAGIFISINGNAAALFPMNESIATGIQPSEADVKLWLLQYYADNQDLILRTSLLWLSPAQIYLILRSMRGLLRAHKNYRISRPKNWF